MEMAKVIPHLPPMALVLLPFPLPAFSEHTLPLLPGSPPPFSLEMYSGRKEGPLDPRSSSTASLDVGHLLLYLHALHDRELITHQAALPIFLSLLLISAMLPPLPGTQFCSPSPRTPSATPAPGLALRDRGQ